MAQSTLQITQVINLKDAKLMLAALKKVRKMCYNSSAANSTGTVLACIRVTENAIGEVESK